MLIAFFGTGISAYSQQTISGNIFDTKGSPMPYATATLLNPNDSTLAYFGITNDQGHYEIKNVKAGNYLLQSAYLGHKPFYRDLSVPVENGLVSPIVMKEEDRDLKTVEIEGERVPIMIKGDTVEYNAGAFKTKPDAAVEDLLKKLPGVQVDRAGNVKAQGEDVKKILVDGKEFFSNDPKIATKNLPADAIKKVQVYDKKSDQAEFTGIDDGSRDKTINLMLKDDKKNGYFGDVSAGVGTDNKYQAAAKLYNFKPTSQFAALGMINNINQFGFSLSDYINFKGGVGNMMNGGGFQINSSMPINFGQPVNGLITSGAGGLNYTYEPQKNRRFNVSYIGNGSHSNIMQDVYTKNFTNNQTFERYKNSTELSDDMGHGFSTNIRNDMDSVQQITLSGNLNLSRGSGNTAAVTRAMIEQAAFNQLDNSTYNTSNGISGSGSAGYVAKMGRNWPLLKVNAEAAIDKQISSDEWKNITSFFNPASSFTVNQFQKNNTDQFNYGGGVTLSRRLGGGYYLDGSVNGKIHNDHYTRKQGTPPDEANQIDSLAVDFTKDVTLVRPGLAIKKNNEKVQFSAGLSLETGTITTQLKNNPSLVNNYAILLPRMRWSYEYANSKRYGANFESRVNTPTVNQLQPVVNTANPLSLFSGNQNLRPEVINTAGLNWTWFDQFSFTSIFANLNGTYTHDKINLARTVNPDLSQNLTYVNVDDDYRADLNVEFSTPIRKLGITLEVGAGETYNRGISPVNGLNNVNTNLTHSGELTLKNRNTDKISVSVGGNIKYTDARYSIQGSLNNKYYSIGYFADVNYTPADKWNLNFTADVSQYNSQSFKNTVTIPLLQAEVSRFFMKANRASVSLKAFDILNKNTGLSRVSELNYLQETRSNIIGRYFMITFKYKLSKLGGEGGPKMDIQIKGQR